MRDAVCAWGGVGRGRRILMILRVILSDQGGEGWRLDYYMPCSTKFLPAFKGRISSY